MIQKSTSDCIVGVVIAPEESIECTERERERERERGECALYAFEDYCVVFYHLLLT